MSNERLEALKYKTDKTLQDLFDIAWERAKIQVKSEIRDGVNLDTCSYRGAGGGCFIGCAIPDEWYDPMIEGVTADGIRSAILVSIDVGDQELCDLQSIHDNYPPESWNLRLTMFAKTHGLTIPSETA